WSTVDAGGPPAPIYDVSMTHQKAGTPLVIVAGKEYGTGSSRDWAAKGTFLLGVKAVIAESFERIHRSNLVGMGVLPLLLQDGMDQEKLGITGDEVIDITGLHDLHPRMELSMIVHRPNGKTDTVPVICRIDTADEVNYYRHGGILHYVLRGMAQSPEKAA
ncbi:MAG TPA: aconitate hydratase, partial [Acetobacteraceae bacterium]|nr:aconitate hydratase [Acetobacteraceae bacterium]